MVRFHALTVDAGAENPSSKLYIWRPSCYVDTSLQFPVLSSGKDENGLLKYSWDLDYQIHGDACCKLITKQDNKDKWEDDAFNRSIKRESDYHFPQDVWLAEGTSRLLKHDPFAQACDMVRIHLITANRYRGGKLYVWSPGSDGMVIANYIEEEEGICFDVPLSGRNRNLFSFKFIQQNGFFEPETANRLWCSTDGKEIWTHSESPHISSVKPSMKKLMVYYQSTFASGQQMHLWHSNSDFVIDVEPIAEQDGWQTFEYPLYTNLPYGFMFRNSTRNTGGEWEHIEATREITLHKDTQVWTLEGDHELFEQKPKSDRLIILEIVDRTPACMLGGGLSLDVWVNQARCHDSEPLLKDIRPDQDGRFQFKTYPEITTSFRFKSTGPQGQVVESIDRHTFKVNNDCRTPQQLYIVLDKKDPLIRKPGRIFMDPPFSIQRPGAWVQDGYMNFAIHAPSATMVEVIGEWTQWLANPIPMQCTLDGSYWWCRVPLDQIKATGKIKYHGVMYKYVINQTYDRQDPAADWVESSDPSKASKLMNHEHYDWQSNDWRTPGWDSLIVYQLHPSRFTGRYKDQNLSPLCRVAQEIKDNAGYLHSIKATGILLMPVNEFAGQESWGYNTAFFYAVESSYGGPDDLKYLVDTCHQHGLAVMLDVVFNHAGIGDNILWSIARDSYFKGDTKWGAMINFTHPQVIHFFEQNLVYLCEKFHIDGFRFDATNTIIHSTDINNDTIIAPGSGRGWEFLLKLRAAVHAVKPECILVAEQLPNDWPLTNYGGSMDSQWCDDFHDRLLDACRGNFGMSGLADAFKISQTKCQQWYECTNYPESHDEVGNTNDRIANVGGFGQGYRRNKVAAAATLLSRGIPMWFMGAESGECNQFLINESKPLDLDDYCKDDQRCKVRNWWNDLSEFRRGNPIIQGPSPLDVRYAQDQLLAFTRGEGQEFYVLLNFGGWAGYRRLDELNLPEGSYRELWNSTSKNFVVEGEDEHTNGGGNTHLNRGSQIHVPDYAVVVLQRE